MAFRLFEKNSPSPFLLLALTWLPTGLSVHCARADAVQLLCEITTPCESQRKIVWLYEILIHVLGCKKDPLVKKIKGYNMDGQVQQQ